MLKFFIASVLLCLFQFFNFLFPFFVQVLNIWTACLVLDSWVRLREYHNFRWMLLHSTSDFIISGMAYTCKAVDIAFWPNLCILGLFCHSTEKNESI